tara:strand:+ start:4384 stop:8493 length:4110 start_codon:yes stop_codon:yes gene_type:complete
MSSGKPKNVMGPSLFSPSFIRGINLGSARVDDVTFSEVSDTNIGSTSSFRYDPPGSPMRSTQQLNIDWSIFENHTFFNSAISKVNVAFDKIINEFPFDGTRKETEDFLDNLTGYENYILDRFPKNTGYLNFYGSSTAGLDQGTLIKVKDQAGRLFPEYSKMNTGQRVLDPTTGSFSIEMQLLCASITNNKQIICQRLVDDDYGFTLGISNTSSTTEASIVFSVTSGSNYMITSGTISKGSFEHVCAVCNREEGVGKLRLYVNEKLIGESDGETEILDMGFSPSHYFTIGSGSIHHLSGVVGSTSETPTGGKFTPTETFSGSIDEFRFFHSIRSLDEQKQFAKRSIFSSPDLRLYFKFNEPSGSTGVNDIVLDSSGKSLHSRVLNYFSVSSGIALRGTGSAGGGTGPVKPPLVDENLDLCPVLFPKFEKVTDLNYTLLLSASRYDNDNPNLITKLIPPHYLEEGQHAQGLNTINGEILGNYSGSSIPGTGDIGSSQLLTALLFVYASQFDEIKLFIDEFSQIFYVDYDENTSASDPFLLFAGEYMGIDLPRIFSDASLLQQVDGEDLTTDTARAGGSLNYVQNQIWRRILTNMREITVSRGTIHSVKSLIRSIGIEPDNVLRIREYGGPSRKTLRNLRVKKSEVSTMIDFSGSLAAHSNMEVGWSLNDQGFLTGSFQRPRLMSPYLSASRFEVGYPEPQGTFVSKHIDYLSRIGGVKKASVVLQSTAQANTNETIILIATDGTSQTYTSKSSETLSSGFFKGTAAYTVAQRMTSLKACIEAKQPGKFTIVQSSTTAANDTLTLTQVQGGDEGNTIVTNTLLNFKVNGILKGASTTVPFTGGRSAVGGDPLFDHNIHGISNDPDDGLFTSGSWTYEAIYQIPGLLTGSHFVTQSLARLHVTGTNAPAKTHGIIFNLSTISGTSKTILFGRPSRSTTASTLKLVLTGANIFDGNPWNISFGRYRADDPISGTISPLSSSYFIRCARNSYGEIKEYFSTASLFSTPGASSDSEQTINANRNSHGAFVVIGSQSIDTAGNYYLNSVTKLSNEGLNPAARYTNFSGRVGHIRFWSRGLSETEFKEHTRNFKSLGSDDPKKGFNFDRVTTGTFGKLRIDTTTDQQVTESNSLGTITLTDFSQNSVFGKTTRPWEFVETYGGERGDENRYFHMSGSGFETSKQIIKPTSFHYSYLSPRFDMSETDEKVRIRSYQSVDKVEESDFAYRAPLHELPRQDIPDDDTRFAVDFSVVQALNEDIMTMFSSLDFFDNALGSPNLMFDEYYPDLDQLKKIYFNRLIDKINIKNFFEFYKWFDSILGVMISQLIPKKTNFNGVNFVIESHVLERNRMRYLSDEIYLKLSEREGTFSDLVDKFLES